MKKSIYIIFIFSVILMLALTFTNTCFASNDKAYAIAGGSAEILVDSNNNFIRSFYIGAGFDAYNIQNPSDTLLRSILLISPKVFSTFSHANSNQVLFETSGLQTGSDIYLGSGFTLCGVQRYAWADTRLAVLAGCETGKDDDNITEQVYGKMSESTSDVVAIGWKKTIEINSAGEWVKNFHKEVAHGENIRDSYTYANSFIYLDENVKSIRVYGRPIITVTASSSRSAKLNDIKEPDDNRKHMIDYEVIYKNDEDLDNISNMLKNEFNDFNPENYKIVINDDCMDGITVIDYILTINEFSTNSGYTIFIEDGKVTELYDNTINPVTNIAHTNLASKSSINLPDNIKSLEEKYKKQAAEKALNINKNSINKEQTSRLFYDVATGKKYIVIITTNMIGQAKLLIPNYFEIK